MLPYEDTKLRNKVILGYSVAHCSRTQGTSYTAMFLTSGGCRVRTSSYIIKYIYAYIYIYLAIYRNQEMQWFTVITIICFL